MSKQSKKERREAKALQETPVVPTVEEQTGPILTPEAPKQPSNDPLPVQEENTTASATTETTKKVTIDPTRQEVVEKSKLDSILDLIETQKQQIEILRESVSQGRLGLAEDKRKKTGQKRVFLKVMEHEGVRKLVVGWKASPDCKLVYSPTSGNPIGEILQSKYSFHDGTESEYIDQVFFTRINDLAYATIESETPELFVLRFDDAVWGPDTLSVHKQFVNP